MLLIALERECFSGQLYILKSIHKISVRHIKNFKKHKEFKTNAVKHS